MKFNPIFLVCRTHKVGLIGKAPSIGKTKRHRLALDGQSCHAGSSSANPADGWYGQTNGMGLGERWVTSYA